MVQLADRLDAKNEAKWQAVWEQRKLYAFDEKDDKRPVFSIDTPPPFTSGDLHMGHVLSYSFFDFVARYKRMSGYNVYYPQGWDCQGFPTEVKVEQKYGRKPPAEFRKLCVDWTAGCIIRMRAQMNQMGFSPDWKYEYQTMSPDYHKRVQYSLLEMYKSNQVYRGEHPVFWCPNCQSALAKTDTEEADRSTFLHDIQFELELSDGKKQPVTIATTRPELMHACVAVLYHPSDERYNKLGVNHAISALGKSVPFRADPDVDPAFGTGVVMCCTFGDKQDVVWMYRHKLPMVRAMDERGKLINAPTIDGATLNGLSVTDARAKLIEHFKSSGQLLSSKPLQQVIKVHDRCKKPIELSLSWQWFARVTDAKDKIIQTAGQMRWVPDFAITYLTDWAQFVEWDWVISRQRVFGTPLPFWHCPKCDKIIPAEAKELPVDPQHMPARNCPTCSGPLIPETSTCDCWIDSSISPLVIGRWPEDKKFLSRVYPASLRPQGVEIVRTWAYYTIYRCQALTGQAPFKELLLNGNVLAPDGKKMSKSLGNVIAPDKLIADYGADAVRIWASL
ncbi:MAG: class I tRNA ligase family protein, partial [Candidatus Micrarchaeota archaeon]|nr:class I tRNA ligase family protein [Candidatus Micrarchaeota archaeon]